MASSGHNQLKLYSYWRSSCSCRVRIALNLKGIKYDYVAVDLVKGEQSSPEFLKLNPLGFVPVLVDGDVVISDSFAILMVDTPFLPCSFIQTMMSPNLLYLYLPNLQAANIVSSSIQPFQNLVVLKYVDGKIDPQTWARHHIERGFAALEKLLKDHSGRYATGEEVHMADLFIAPQVDGAIRRFKVDMKQFPLLLGLHEEYGKLPSFEDAMPEKQPDAPSS
ncbi:Glutathione S-transferase zeta class [Linum perenne]